MIALKSYLLNENMIYMLLSSSNKFIIYKW